MALIVAVKLGYSKRGVLGLVLTCSTTTTISTTPSTSTTTAINTAFTTIFQYITFTLRYKQSFGAIIHYNRRNRAGFPTHTRLGLVPPTAAGILPITVTWKD